MNLLTELIAWLRGWWNEPVDDTVPLEVQIIDLAEVWHVDVSVARRMVNQYAMLYGVDAAIDRLRGMSYSEAVREIGERWLSTRWSNVRTDNEI